MYHKHDATSKQIINFQQRFNRQNNIDSDQLQASSSTYRTSNLMNVVNQPKVEYIDSNSNNNEEENKNQLSQNKEEKSQDDDEFKLKPNIANEWTKVKVKFRDIVEYFKEASSKKALQKHELTRRFFNDYLFKNCRENNYVFSLLRLILPGIDRERGNYGVKEKVLADITAEALSLSKQQKERLIHFKNPNYQPYGGAVGDFSEVFHSSVQGFCPDKSTITVGEVNRSLDELAASEDRAGQAQVMRDLIRKCTAEELKWLVRIILKDLKIGLSHERVLPIYHVDALEYYNATSSLREVCKEFVDKTHSLKNVLRMFHPIKPMLSARKKLEELPLAIENKVFLIETKFDGERIQCHITPEEVRFYSRNSNDYTHIYGRKMADIVRNNLISTHSAILDGEIIVVDRQSGLPVQFGMNKHVALEEQQININNKLVRGDDNDDEREGDLQLCYKVFDILYIKGALGEECNLMNVGLPKRKKLLQKIVREVKHSFELVNGIESASFDSIVNEFNNAVSRNEEGIIIKQIDSLYYPNQRGPYWFKMKGDYLEGLTDTLDLLIIGGYFGKKSYRTGSSTTDWTDDLTHFLVGLSLKIDRQNPENSIIIPFCRIGTGYTGKELQTLRNELRPHWEMWNSKQFPPYFYKIWKPSLEDKPDAYINSPKNSKIVEVKAAEIIRSHTWPTDYTLRFPRVMKIRYNKDWYECMTLDELKGYAQNLKQKNVGNDEESENSGSENFEEGGTKKQKRSKGRGVEQQPGKKFKRGIELRNQVLLQFQDTDTSNIQIESNLFMGFVFCIINLEEKSIALSEGQVGSYGSKSFLEQEIHKHSGNKVQNDCYLVTHYIAEHFDFRVEAIIRKYNCNILRPNWVLHCLQQKKVLDWSPRYLLYSNEYLSARNLTMYDMYGDSYTEPVSKADLKEIMQEMYYCKTEIEQNQDLQDEKLVLQREICLAGDGFGLSAIRRQQVFCILDQQDKENKEQNLEFLQLLIQNNKDKIVHKISAETIDYIIDVGNFSQDEKDALQFYLKMHKKTQLITINKLKKILLNQ